MSALPDLIRKAAEPLTGSPSDYVSSWSAASAPSRWRPTGRTHIE